MLFKIICNYSVTVANSVSTDRSGTKQCWLLVGMHLAGGGRSVRKAPSVPGAVGGRVLCSRSGAHWLLGEAVRVEIGLETFLVQS